MTRFDRYLLREGLPPFLFGLLLYSGLIVLGTALPRLPWVVGAPLGQLFAWWLLQVPAATVQALPIALLLAVLLAYGRLSAHSELLAVQASGLALRRLTLPFLGLGLVAASFALYLNERVLPVANAEVSSLWWELTGGGSGLFRLARQNIPLGAYVLHFEHADPLTEELSGVRLEAWQGRRLTVFRAERASFSDEGLRLYNYRLNVIDLDALQQEGAAAATLRRLVRVDNRAERPNQSYTITTSESYRALIARFAGEGFEDARSLRMLHRAAVDPDLSERDRRQAAALFHRKLAEPLANLTLLLIAVPLAVRYARNRAVAFGLSLVVTLVWYVLLALGQLFAQSGAVPAWLGVWSGSMMLGAVGCYLLYRKSGLRTED